MAAAIWLARFGLSPALAVPRARRVGDAEPAPRRVVHDHQRIEALFFDGRLDPAGGVLTPDLTSPGLGVAFRARDAERYRTA